MADVVGLFREIRAGVLSELPDAEVLFGDRHLGEHYEVGRPRVVLTWGDGEFRGPRDYNTNPPSMYEKRPSWEAHLYIAEAETIEDLPGDAYPGEPRDLQRLQDLSDLQDTVARAIHAAAHGSHGGGGADIISYTASRDTEILRHGEACIMIFDVGVAVIRGPALVSVSTTEPAINGGAGGGLIVNPPP